MAKSRFIVPGIFLMLVGGFAAYIIWSTTNHLPPSDVLFFQNTRMADIILIMLAISIPITIIEYYILAVPIAGIFLIGNRIIRSASYEMDIMNIGNKFEGRHMIRRAAAPALFSIASSDMLREIVLPYAFPGVVSISEIPVGSIEYAILSLLGALLFMPVSLLIFMPTWILNDTGIVTHLKENKMDIRQGPDTQGLGRWYSSIFGGYALIAFPLTMLNNHVLPQFIGGTLFQGDNLLNSFLLIIGLPLFVMAFIIPVIMFNERNQTRVRKSIASLANRLGADIVRREKMEKAKRIVREGILTEEGGTEIVSTAKTTEKPKRKRRKRKKKK